MARQTTVLSVFVASPSDVEEERNRLEDVIRQLNLGWASTGISLELVKWETHSYPGFGQDPQSVIDEQLPHDYDIFIGIMWCKAGTPTGCAESGTIDEFRQAKKRHDEDPNSVQVMFYFKDAPISPSKIDHQQLQTVAKFRATLGNEGLYYWQFNTVADFEKNVRLHLTRQVADWQGRNDESNDTENQPATPAPSVGTGSNFAEDEEEEPGIWDLEEEIEDAFSELNDVSGHISDATAEVGKMMRMRTAEIQTISQRDDLKSTGRKLLRGVIVDAGADMDTYVGGMDHLLPLFESHLDAGVSLFTKAMPILVRLSESSGDDRSRLKNTVKTLRESMTGAADTLEEFKASVNRLPSMTTAMNRSRRATARVIQRMINAMRGGQLQLAEVEKLMDGWLSE